MENIKNGKVSYGAALEMPSADVAEVLACSDYDWLFIDGEHGAPAVRVGLYGKIENYQERIDDESLLMNQIESKKGIESPL